MMLSKAYNDTFGTVKPANNDDNVTVDSEQSNTCSKKLEKSYVTNSTNGANGAVQANRFSKSTSIEESVVFYCQSHLFGNICKKWGKGDV